MAAWLIWTITALVSWGLWAVSLKLLGNALTAEQVQAYSTLGLIPILLPLAFSKKASLKGCSGKGLALAFIGGIITCLGNIPCYAAIARGEKFAAVISLTALAPMVTVILAVIILRERLNRIQRLGLLLAGAAIWLFNVREDRALLSSTVLVAILPICLWGLSGFLQKVATNHISAEAAALVYLGAFVPVGLVYGYLDWPPQDKRLGPFHIHDTVFPIAARDWILVILVGFFLSFGNYAVIRAYGHSGKAAVIAPLVNLFPLISVTAAWLWLGEQLGGREIAGIVCALASAAALSMESTATTNTLDHAQTDH